MNGNGANIDRILCDAVEIESPDRRSEYLDAACAGDPSLRHQVDRLLSDHFRAGDFLERPAIAAVTETAGLPDHQFPGPSVPANGTLGDFRILREIGRGGMGIVYEAEEISLGRRVALKLLQFAALLDPQQLARFRTEARAAAILQHPHIVPVYGVGCERGVHYYAMQYIEGTTLAAVLNHLRNSVRNRENSEGDAEPTESEGRAAAAVTAELGRLSTEHATQASDYFRSIARIGVQAAEALDHAHASGVLHRDIKPANLILDARGNLWITDFGTARIEAQAGLTMTGDVIGTPRYMSPEQVLGKRAVIDHRSDIYSFGATLYELLTLSHAVPGSNRQEVLNRIATDEPRPARQINPAIPADLSTIVMKALSRAPEQRYDTAEELAADLRRFLNREHIKATPPTLSQRLTTWSVRHKAIVATVTTTFMLSTLALAIATVLISRARTEALSTTQLLRTALDEKQTALDQKAAALIERGAALEHEVQTARHVYPLNIASAHSLISQRNFVLARELLELYEEGKSPADRRGFEWHYLCGLANNGGARILRGHQENVFSVAFSKDSQLVASASGDHTVRLWNPATGDVVRTLTGHTSDVNWVVFSPTGNLLATASDDHTIGLWNPATGMRQEKLCGHADMVQAVVFSPDGKLLVSGGTDGELKTWSVTTGQELSSIQAHSVRIHSVAVSEDGTRCATSSQDQSVKVWSLPSLEHVVTFRVPAGEVLQSVAFRPGTEHLVTCSRTGQLKTFDIRIGEPIHEEHADFAPLGLAFSANGESLGIASDASRPVTVFHGAHCRAVYPLSDAFGSWCVAFAPNGQYMAAGSDHEVALWNLSKPPAFQALAKFPRGISCVAVSPDCQSVLCGVSDDSLHLLNLVNGSERQNVQQISGSACQVRYSPDGRVLAVVSRDRTIQIRDAGRDDEIAVLGGFSKVIQSVAFSVDGRTFVACDRHSVRAWETTSWTLIDQWPKLRASQVGLSFEDGLFAAVDHQLCYSGPDGRMSVLSRFLGHPLRAMAVSNDGTHVAAGFSDGRIEAIDTRRLSFKKAILAKSIGGHGAGLLTVVFSPDNKTLATASVDGKVTLCDVQTGTAMLTHDLSALLENSDLKQIKNIVLDFASDGSALVAGVTYTETTDPEAEKGVIYAWYAHRSESRRHEEHQER